MFDIGDH